ncbi:MAG: hypothetical protein ACT4O1_07185 [Gemmatimonadota bacterium]
MLNWTPWALPGLAVFVVGLALAHFIYKSRPDRAQNRRLAAQLMLEAIVVGLMGGSAWFFADARLVVALSLTANVLVWPKLWTYYSFLATLDTPLARPLQSRRALNGLLVLTMLAGSTVLLRPEWYGSAAIYWPAVGASHMPPGSAFVPIFWMWSFMWLVGLSFSISALRHARTPLRREQARAYLIAFGARDISFLLLTLTFTVVPPTYAHFQWVFILFPTVWLVYYPLVAWGILKHQLFDIELRVKRGVQRSVVAAAIAGAFFAGSYALEQFININNFVLGLLAAGFVTAAFQPLQRMAEKLADRLMPGVNTSESYIAERKHEVYRNAVEGALQDGTITERERAILMKLRESLGVDAAEALRIERDVLGGVVPEAAPALAPSLS